MTGKTVEEAVEAALDQLGVAETDAEVVVVEEPKIGHVRSPAKQRPDQGAGSPGSASSEAAVAALEHRR